MSGDPHDFDLGSLRLSAGEGQRIELHVALSPLELGLERYQPDPARVPAMLEISCMNGGGYALRIRLQAALRGPCMRCLQEAAPLMTVDAREVDRPSSGEELSSPYVDGDTLHIDAWANDAFVLALPAQIVCREDCAGLCPICAIDLNEAGPEHAHEPELDPRWAKLRELKLD
ncbi:MAG TPA: DUF177 domain-containing protein [Solirubrobacteraceae bacterium]|nr:DUF177 domain-containing protein [Solirubrobacteraceae bacterium]